MFTGKSTMANWMANLPFDMKQKKITGIFLPGTHDSAAYTFKFDTLLNKTGAGSLDVAKIDRMTFNLLGAKDVATSWSKTQNMNIYAQLKYGVRYFDFRLLYSLEKKVWVLHHSYCAENLEAVLSQIARYFKECPKEIAIFNFRIDQHKEQYDAELKQQILNKIGDIMLQNKDSSRHTLSIQQIMNANKNAIVYINCYLEDVNFWESNHIRGDYFNTTDVNYKIAKCIEEMKTIQKEEDKTIYILQCTLTPKDEHIIRSVFQPACLGKPESIYDLSQKINMHALTFASQPEFVKVNGMIVDFIESSPLQTLTHTLNFK